MLYCEIQYSNSDRAIHVTVTFFAQYLCTNSTESYLIFSSTRG